MIDLLKTSMDMMVHAAELAVGAIFLTLWFGTFLIIGIGLLSILLRILL